ncbi:hypothetical protein STRIP9103_04921 [Streptomyces ipomoeae 91-03]|uniref:Uncharacterized protein n=1 Tax=Streptomyces ipomoeae 91-03 TaxID=698759 RepID=L1KL88_9ACTN|nr:hypothetical protein STRIP9103_04921 [Streptomyces ipomoeae 91-03]
MPISVLSRGSPDAAGEEVESSSAARSGTPTGLQGLSPCVLCQSRVVCTVAEWLCPGRYAGSPVTCETSEPSWCGARSAAARCSEGPAVGDRGAEGTGRAAGRAAGEADGEGKGRRRSALTRSCPAPARPVGTPRRRTASGDVPHRRRRRKPARLRVGGVTCATLRVS